MTTADDDDRGHPHERGYTYIEGEAIRQVDDRPGGMARLARELADAGVSIYGHPFLGRWGDSATFTFVVDDAGRRADPRTQGHLTRETARVCSGLS
jgi:hypothetical protein